MPVLSCFSSQHYDTPMPRPLDAARAPFTVRLDPQFSPPINSSVHRSSTGAKPSSPGLQNNRNDSGLVESIRKPGLDRRYRAPVQIWRSRCIEEMPVFFSTEKKCKTKTRTTAKLQKLPTAKLIEIAVANRNFFSHNLEIALTYCVLKHSKHFQIENDVYEIGKSAICWLGFCFKFQFLRSYTINITQLAIETEGEFS